MNWQKQNTLSFGAMTPFDMKLTYGEMTCEGEKRSDDSHVHPECEIYIYLSGDVSFMVERQIYPILPGSIVITRPYEYHHCIYHSNEPHRHIWILFSSNGNEALLPRFFQRAKGKENHLTLHGDAHRELLTVCHELIDTSMSEAERQYRFFHLLHLLETADVSSAQSDGVQGILDVALAYIDRNFGHAITVEEIARTAHVSVNTLERHFRDRLQMTPTAYLKKKRLAHAAACLHSGSSVSEACESSGFSDYSHFISLFKKHYGMTPLKYKKEVSGE